VYQVKILIQTAHCDTDGLDILWNKALGMFPPSPGILGAGDSGTSRDWSDTRKRFRILEPITRVRHRSWLACARYRVHVGRERVGGAEWGKPGAKILPSINGIVGSRETLYVCTS
jgi:hypothetical protein